VENTVKKAQEAVKLLICRGLIGSLEAIRILEKLKLQTEIRDQEPEQLPDGN
jgi:hypothetical protein